MALGRESWALWLCISLRTITLANSPVISTTWCQFPETKERGLDFRFLGYFFSQLWFYGLFHKMSFPATFCWYSLSVRFSIHAYEPRHLKHVSWRGQLVFSFSAQTSSLPHLFRCQNCKAPNSLFCSWLQNTSSIQRSKGQFPQWILRCEYQVKPK